MLDKQPFGLIDIKTALDRKKDRGIAFFSWLKLAVPSELEGSLGLILAKVHGYGYGDKFIAGRNFISLEYLIDI